MNPYHYRYPYQYHYQVLMGLGHVFHAVRG